LAAPPRSAELAARSEALADSSRQLSDGYLYRLRVQSSDGHLCTVTWQIDTHRAECRKYVLRELSHQFRVETPEAALEVLDSWTKERLVAHLGTFTREKLKPPSMNT
jgi:DTW domain-containing protein YfiP